MAHDINQYGMMIMPKANTTLKAKTKAELIEYIRTLEHNYNRAVEFNEIQARNIEQMMKDGRLIEQKHGTWGMHEGFYFCPNCYTEFKLVFAYCPICGSKNGEVETDLLKEETK